MRPTLRLGIPLLALWLAGCASGGDPMNRYLLPPDAAANSGVAATGEAGTSRSVLVATPRLAGFLNAEGIVLQLDDITLNEAQANLWAAPLSQQIERGLRERLAKRLPGRQVLVSRGNSRTDSVTLEVTLDAFQGRYDGVAVAAGQWLIRDENGQVLSMQPFDTEVTLDSDGYPALVRALGLSLDGVADDIARSLLAQG
ncbi:PqiC family protein [Halomonas sp. V046]|uniref:PqiC family protein n=1 Tax=Halomonas sp. V046 TaxID=3459611 RepID=UPI004045059E